MQRILARRLILTDGTELRPGLLTMCADGTLVAEPFVGETHSTVFTPHTLTMVCDTKFTITDSNGTRLDSL